MLRDAAGLTQAQQLSCSGSGRGRMDVRCVVTVITRRHTVASVTLLQFTVELVRSENNKL